MLSLWELHLTLNPNHFKTSKAARLFSEFSGPSINMTKEQTMKVVEMFGVWQLSKSGQAKSERKLCVRSVCQRAKQLDIARAKHRFCPRRWWLQAAASQEEQTEMPHTPCTDWDCLLGSFCSGLLHNVEIHLVCKLQSILPNCSVSCTDLLFHCKLKMLIVAVIIRCCVCISSNFVELWAWRTLIRR